RACSEASGEAFASTSAPARAGRPRISRLDRSSGTRRRSSGTDSGSQAGYIDLRGTAVASLTRPVATPYERSRARAALLAARRAMPATARRAADAAIRARLCVLLASRAWPLRERVIAAYWPMHGEPDVPPPARAAAAAAIRARVCVRRASRAWPLRERVSAAYWPMHGEPALRPLFADWVATGAGLALPTVLERGAPLRFARHAPGGALR